jgi:hypothetical protein
VTDGQTDILSRVIPSETFFFHSGMAACKAIRLFTAARKASLGGSGDLFRGVRAGAHFNAGFTAYGTSLHLKRLKHQCNQRSEIT